MLCALPFCSVSANVVALVEVLSAYDSLFQVAVRNALLEDGFELGSCLPNLQLAREIRDAIGWDLERRGFSAAWESLKSFLDWADDQGVLLDLGGAAS